MSTPDIDTRWVIPMTPDQMMDSIKELYYLQRASAHILMGWMTKVKGIRTKLLMGRHGFPDFNHAYTLRSRLHIMNKLKDETIHIPEGWLILMRTIDATDQEKLMLDALYGVIKPRVLALFKNHVSHTDPIGDDPTLRIMAPALWDLEQQLEAVKPVLAPIQEMEAVKKFRDEICNLWDRRHQSHTLLPEEDAIWSPLDRVPVPVRPDHFKSPPAGKLRTEPVDWVNNPKDLALYLHRAVDDELQTLEFMGRCSYEHPGMPGKFHYDMIRQAYDEARHAQLYLRHFPKYNLEYGDLDAARSAYLLEYEFEGVEPNSRQELLWRILLRQTFNEGRSLDGLELELKRWNYLKRDDFLHTADQIYTDEQLHCGSGMKWSLYLCDGDKERQLEERRKAVESMTRRILERRAEFTKKHGDLVEQEAREYVNLILNRTRFPFKKPINVAARKRAGQTLEDLQQYLTMDKLPPEHHDLPDLGEYFEP